MNYTQDKQFFDTKVELSVKTYDIDFAGIVSNIVYVRWLEDLRLAMMATHYPLERQIEQGFAPAILQTKIDYKRAIKVFDRVYARMWVSEIDSIRWIVKSEIFVGDKVAAIAEQTGLFINISRGRPIAIPNELVDKYAEYKLSVENTSEGALNS
jgi:acyl-CoA thioester hydrolase